MEEEHKLYNTLKDREEEISRIEPDLIAPLRIEGYTVKGKLPKLENDAPKYLDLCSYNNNNIVSAMKNGVDVNTLVDSVISQKKFGLGLPWKKKERKKYNDLVDQLEAVVPGAHNLEAHSIFAPIEGSKIMNLIYGAVFGGGMSYVIDSNASPEDVRFTAGVGAIVTSLASASLNTLSNPKRLKKSIKDKVEYLDNVLGLEEMPDWENFSA